MFATRTSPLVKANPTQATDHAHRRDTPTFSWPVAHMTERTREQLIVLARSVFLYFSARPNRVRTPP